MHGDDQPTARIPCTLLGRNPSFWKPRKSPPPAATIEQSKLLFCCDNYLTMQEFIVFDKLIRVHLGIPRVIFKRFMKVWNLHSSE